VAARLAPLLELLLDHLVGALLARTGPSKALSTPLLPVGRLALVGSLVWVAAPLAPRLELALLFRSAAPLLIRSAAPLLELLLDHLVGALLARACSPKVPSTIRLRVGRLALVGSLVWAAAPLAPHLELALLIRSSARDEVVASCPASSDARGGGTLPNVRQLANVSAEARACRRSLLLASLAGAEGHRRRNSKHRFG
jgi:hypothetical protein